MLDCASLHAVSRQRVGELDVLLDVVGGKLTDDPGVGADRDGVFVDGEHGAARAVVDVKLAVVAVDR